MKSKNSIMNNAEFKEFILSLSRYDGYVHATALCKMFDKKINHYLTNKCTKQFLSLLTSDMNVTLEEIVHVIIGGNPKEQGTWVHPRVAINLLQWVDPKFAVKISQLINSDKCPLDIDSVLHDDI